MKLSQLELEYLTITTKVTDVLPRDCVAVNDSVGLMVRREEIGKLLGKEGAKIRHLKKAIGNNNIIVVQSAETPEDFLSNAFHPARPKSVKVEESVGIVSFHEGDKFKVSRQKIEIVKQLARRNFGLEDLRARFA